MIAAAEAALREANPAPSVGEDPRTVIRNSLRNTVALLEDGGLAPLIASLVGELPHNEKLRRFGLEAEREGRRLLRTALGEAAARGLLRSTDHLDGLIDLILGGVYYRVLITHERVDDAFLDQILDTVFAD